MKYNFDKIIDRQKTNAVSVEGFRGYLFGDYDNVEFPMEDHELIKMWVADMEFEAAPEILEAIHRRVDHGILGYTMVFDESYNRSLVNWINKRHSFRFDENHFVTSKGVIPALFYLISKLCKAGEKALIMTPSYAFFKHAADANGTELVYSKLTSTHGIFHMDMEDIREKTADTKVTTLIFCNPHNPTGRLWTPEELKELGDICFENGVSIISDEIHCDLVRKDAVFTPMQKVFPESDRIITCISASKTFNLAGLLLANVIIPNQSLREQWQSDHLPIENPLSLAAYQAAYHDGEEWLAALTDYLDENFKVVDQYLKDHLPKAKFVIPESTYLAWIDVNAYVEDVEDLTLYFAQKGGILLEGGNMFLDNSAGFIRLNLACPRSRIIEGMKRIHNSLSD